ncbi:MAG TPA: hypothetical protein VF188_04140 [Longimicrobiales bacterium]
MSRSRALQHPACLIVLLLSGCISVGPPLIFQAVAPSDADAFRCITDAARSEGYTVTDANRDAGTIEAEHEVGREDSPLSPQSTIKYVDRIVFSIFRDDNGTNIRATIDYLLRNVAGESVGSEDVVSPDESAKQDVETILSKCGEIVRTAANEQG